MPKRMRRRRRPRKYKGNISGYTYREVPAVPSFSSKKPARGSYFKFQQRIQWVEKDVSGDRYRNLRRKYPFQ